MMQTLYLKCQPEDIGDFVLLTGDPARVDRVAEQFETCDYEMQNREFYVRTGHYKQQRFSGASSGIGAPSAAIAIEELAQLGVKAIVRVGTMMGVEAPMGSYVISTGAVRFEGTSRDYLPLEYPAIPDWSLASHLHQAATSRGLACHMGLTTTYDSFYPKMAPALVGRGLPDVEQLKQAPVQALDMETSLLYILGMRLRLPVVSMCLVTNTADPFAVLDSDKRRAGEEALIQTVLDGILVWQASHT
ncbi:MAG: nucleoside phosphorylase [Anaerolineae bacterium]|nr:nucleoside phosphorylase [Anaerolineae bacterium]